MTTINGGGGGPPERKRETTIRCSHARCARTSWTGRPGHASSRAAYLASSQSCYRIHSTPLSGGTRRFRRVRIRTLGEARPLSDLPQVRWARAA
eukprot:scaffold16876_cov119-Isochrysis_galbana.AAC.1